MNFYIADTHFLHPRAISMDSRPFSSYEEMANKMIENWNQIVSVDDTVYILGDFAMRKQGQEAYIACLKNLQGNKVLILGNHDFTSFSKEQKRSANLKEVCDYKEVKEEDGSTVICSHYPILFYRRAYDPTFYHFCGHVHQTREDYFLEKWMKELVKTQNKHGDNYGNILNVGCMKNYMNYTPQSFNFLKQIVDERRRYWEEEE